MATAGSWSQLGGYRLHSETLDALKQLGFPMMTPVQAASVPLLLNNKDAVVQAETGSGKTLAFLVPIAELIVYGKLRTGPRKLMKVLIIVPTRELASQVHRAAQELFCLLSGNVGPVLLTGGNVKGEAGPGDCVEDLRLVIATPGRLDAALTQNMLSCRGLEILVMDEADRLLDMGFTMTLASILRKLPKQRRTALYSATQTSQLDELARAGLRNPVRVSLRVKGLQKGAGIAAQNERRIPSTLSCYYQLSRQEDKLGHLIRLLRTEAKGRVIVYFLTCFCVDFCKKLPLAELVGDRKRPILSLHGKQQQIHRTKSLRTFERERHAILLCTDVAARGLDIQNVDWIVQFDPPQDPDVYIHRVGRAGRLGRTGRALLYLSPHEDAYIDFLKLRKCPITDFVLEYEERMRALDNEGIKRPLSKVVDRVKSFVLADRAVLEAGEKAFLSYLRAYKEHQCVHLFKLSDLDIGSVARSFSLIKLPRFAEFKRLSHKIVFEPDRAVNVRDIKYKNKEREKHRQRRIAESRKNHVRKEDRAAVGSKKNTTIPTQLGKRKHCGGNLTSDNAEREKKECTDEINKEASLLRKVKRGKLSMKEFDMIMGYS